MGFYVWEIDKEKQLLRLKYLIHQDLRGKLHYQIKEFPYGQDSLLEILRLPYKKQKISHFTVFKIRISVAISDNNCIIKIPFG